MAFMRSGVRSPSAPPSLIASIEKSDEIKHHERKFLLADTIAALFLFLATAAVVVWQNSRLGVLWDLSYVLENSYRLSIGDIPYRDFPFPYAPLTFLIQAALIKLSGRVFWHHVAYCALAGGLATVLTWRILLRLLRETIGRARLMAFLLSLPLVVLGIYCVFPHPFYDPDCTLAILLSVLLLLQLDRPHLPSWRAFITGAALVIPLFVKQNVGLALLLSAMLAITVLMAIELWQRRSIRRYGLVIGGALLGTALALWLIHLTAGLGNYWHWTITFAAERRTPPRGDMLGVYTGKALLLWIGVFAAGAVLLWIARRRNRGLLILAAFLMATPFAWPAIYLLRDQDSSERADRLLALWPLLLIVAFITAMPGAKLRKGVALVLPFILIATVNGAFMSQQLWGSTYAIWPLFMILLASTVAAMTTWLGESSSWITTPIVIVATVSLVIAGSFYVRSHERLDYANLSDGEITRSTLPQLRGLSIRGQWMPDFEELVRYTEREIPRDDGLLILPGEDLFYYTTGRHPRFPALLFDHTANPYSPEEILKLCRDRDIRGVIVKQELQLEDDQVDQDKERITEVLEQDFEQVESLGNYDIYRRSQPGNGEDEP